MSQPSSTESSPEHNLTDMGEFVDEGFEDRTGMSIFDDEFSNGPRNGQSWTSIWGWRFRRRTWPSTNETI